MVESIGVVVPALNEAAGLRSFLAALPADHDVSVTVVDGGSSDETAEIAAGFPGVRVVQAPRGRAAQMNAGAWAARSDLLLFLHADTRLPPDGFARIRAALAAPGVAAGSFRLAFDRDDPWLWFYALCSRINLPLFTYGDQGLFLRRATFERIGGFREMPILEDLEIQGRLRRLGRFVKLAAPVVTSARRFVQRGPLRQQAWNTALVLAYRLGIPPATLRRFYDDARPAAARQARAEAEVPAVPAAAPGGLPRP